MFWLFTNSILPYSQRGTPLKYLWNRRWKSICRILSHIYHFDHGYSITSFVICLVPFACILFAFVAPVDWCNDCRGRVLEILWYVFVCSYDSMCVVVQYMSVFMCTSLASWGVWCVYVCAASGELGAEAVGMCVCSALCCFPTAVSGTSSPSCAGRKNVGFRIWDFLIIYTVIWLMRVFDCGTSWCDMN